MFLRRELLQFLAVGLFSISVLSAPPPHKAQPNIVPPSPSDSSPEPLPSNSRARNTTGICVGQWQKNNLVDWEKLKYFHEPGGDDICGHYDNRFFSDVVSYEERTDTLTNMIRAYLVTFRTLGLETWIAHGTLLGWWWNGKMLPWDWDVDVQVSYPTIIYLGDHLNMSTHTYVSPDDGQAREYLLDVNPHSRNTSRGDGTNIIDARWIDPTNGLYIDITALSEKHPDKQPGVWSCKNSHRYRTKDLYPMRTSTYEGVPVSIPYAYNQILMEEYSSNALVSEEHEG